MAKNKVKPNKKVMTFKMLKEIEKIASTLPELAGKYALVRIHKKASTKQKPCILWGRDPVTGERICVKYKDC